MAEHDELSRSVALARGALGPPPDARARVRARLAESALAESALEASRASARAGTGALGSGAASLVAGLARRRGRALVRALAWTSIGLCAGYWLGFHRIGAAWVEGASPPRALDATPSASPPSPSLEPTTPAHAASPAAAEPADSGAPSAAVTLSAPPRRHAPARRHPGAPPSASARRPAASPGDAFAAELALLERAERAIRAGEGALALALLDQLEHDFPTTSLREERAAARVLARCAETSSADASERAEARADAEQFLAHSSSVYADRVRTLCQLGPK